MLFRRVCSVIAMVASTVTIGVITPGSITVAACEAPVPTGAVAAGAQPTGFHAVAPVRLVDTRESAAVIGAGCTLVLDLSTNNAVPAAAESLALNVTAVDAESRGFVTAHPCGSPRPSASSVNPRRSDATPNSVLVQVDETRRICLFTNTATHLIVDMTGWFGRFGAPFHAATASARVLDTRTAPRPDGGVGLLTAASELRVPMARQSVDAAAEAVAVNVTVTDAALSGFVTVYPCGEQRPPTSTVNFAPVEQRSNHVVVGLGGDGTLCLWSNVAVHVIVDVEGWFGGEPGSGTLFRPFLGSRVLDTRDGTGGVSAKLATNATVSFDPSNGARLAVGSTVALNVVATEAESAGYLTLYPCGSAPPPTSAVNAVVGTESTNVAFVTVDATSRVCVFASAPTHVVADVIGTFGAGGPLRQLTISQLSIGQTFSPDAHDYTVRCVAGANPMTIHAVGAPGTTVSITRSSAIGVTPSGQVADQTLSLGEDEAFVVRAGRPGAVPEQYWVRCLPHDFPILRTTGTETPDPGWYLTDAAFPTSPANTDQNRFVMILDNRSVPVWYHRVSGPSIDLTLMPDGSLAWVKLLGLAFGATAGGTFDLHRLDGTLVRSISTVSGPTDHHDIAELANGNVVLATYVPRQHVDLTALGVGFTNDELVYDSHLEEIRPDGTVAWTWKSEDHIPVSASTFAQRLPGAAGLGVDLVHVNSIHVAPDGDLIVSARHTDAVYKIRRNTAGDVVWRIGGNQSDVTFVGDPLNGFARQHDAQLLPNGDLRLFDNRTNVGRPRAVEYALDLTKHTATLVRSLSTPDVLVSGGVGSVRADGDGDTVVTWGGSPRPAFTEFDAAGDVVQATTMVGHYPYRVDKQPIDALDIDLLRLTAGR